MSIEAMTLVLHHSQASGAAQMIMMGIANHQGDGGAYPSISTLAKYGKVTERRVQQIIRELEAGGELMIINNSGQNTGTGATNLYKVILTCPDDCDGTMNHRKRQGVKSDDTRGEISMLQGVKLTSPKPVIEPLKKPISPLATEIIEFDKFYKIYPRKKKPLEAKRAFEKALKLASADEIIAGAIRFANDPNLPETTYVPYPATWLNGGCWMDGALPERIKTAEEKALEMAERNRRIREADLKAAEQVRLENEALRAKAEPPPICEHGEKITKCRKCLLGIN